MTKKTIKIEIRNTPINPWGLKDVKSVIIEGKKCKSAGNP